MKKPIHRANVFVNFLHVIWYNILKCISKEVRWILDRYDKNNSNNNSDPNGDELYEFLAQFDDNIENYTKSIEVETPAKTDEDDTDVIPVHRSRRKNKAANNENSKKNQKKLRSEAFAENMQDEKENEGNKSKMTRSKSKKEKPSKPSSTGGNGGKKKYKFNKKQFLKFIIAVIVILALLVIGYVASVIIKSPSIDPDNIYSQLSESSILYDDKGELIENVFSEHNRTNVEYKQLPQDLVDAIVSLEDKTFWDHHGFNFIRILGAIKDAFSSGSISGTSTITQQLARNVYLPDKMSEHSMSRKIAEAYYTVLIEKKLTKEQIVEAYLNTIYLGYGNSGVQSASMAYFSKNVEDLSLEQCAAIAALPQSPSAYELVRFVPNDSVSENDKTILKRTSRGTYVYNDSSKERREICLKLMLDQGKITKAEYDKAVSVSLKKMLNPNFDAIKTNSSYFTDYVIEEVVNDLMSEYNYSYEEAYDRIYSKGYKIYTTMDSTAQKTVETEFDNPANFPSVVNIRRDGAGNIVSEGGAVMLYAYSNYFDSNNVFTFKNNEIKKNDDGSLTIKSGKRLNIYTTEVQDKTDYSVEFKDMYIIENNRFYSIAGGFVNIPQQYKTKDSNDDLIVSAEFIKENPDFFTENDNGTISLHSSSYTLNQRIVQPQGAMVISDNSTGQIKAMVGGREISGRMLYNRAIHPRQPGSSIKPLGVYGAALQKSFDAASSGNTLTFQSVGKQGTKLYGNYLTAASIIDDEPTMFEGRIWPQNSYGGYHGLYTMRGALQQSVNVCAVKIFQQVGADYSSQLVKKFGVSTIVDSGDVNDMNAAALALGGMTKGVTALDMANAYTAFPNGGVNHQSSSYTKVLNRKGEIVLEKKPKATKVLDEGVAFIMTDMLKSVVSQGIGSPAAISGVQTGGKTGTTSDQYDIWFDGFTPTYSAALWIGNDVNIELSSYSYAAAKLWGRIMNQIPNAKKGSYKVAPANVITASVDTPNGVRSEYFTKGTVSNIKIHGSAVICSESGYLATPLCLSTRSITGLLRPYLPSTKVGDYKSELPHYYCNLHNNNPGKYPIDPNKKLQEYKPPVEDPDDEKPDDPDKPDDEKPNPDDNEKPNPDKPGEDNDNGKR